WIASMRPEERERMVDTIFHILRSDTNAETVQDLLDGGRSTVTNVLRTWGDTPTETRVFMQKMILRLLMAMRQSEPKTSNLPAIPFQKPRSWK
ncbi:MAG: hypothetical protein ACI4TG_05755, partial [Ruminococcus sp.]